MFGIGWAELLLIAIVALVVVGPDKLPEAARQTGKFYGRLQRLWSEARADLRTEVELAGLKEAEKADCSKNEQPASTEPFK
jgi:twin arginine-targeting protein translocase TatB